VTTQDDRNRRTNLQRRSNHGAQPSSSRRDDNDNAGDIGINTSGELTIGIGGGLTVDTDGDVGISLGGGVSIDTDGDVGFSL